MRTLAILTAEGFTSKIVEDDKGVVRFKADADIDADGANGQNGARAAYTKKNDGSEYLANGGMGIRNGRVVFTQSWGPSIAVVGPGGYPLVKNGIVICKTSYRFKGKIDSDPAAWVDAQTVPYIVVPPVVVQKTQGAVKGCFARARYKGKWVEGIVADVGPRTKNGEISIRMAELLGIPSSPKTGGIDGARVDYEVYPGVHGSIAGKKIPLLAMSGKYILP